MFLGSFFHDLLLLAMKFIACPHWDRQLVHTSGRVSILVDVNVLYAVAGFYYITLSEVVVIRMMNFHWS